ncbi:hypothetical protein [Rahnella sp. AN3-3W3]|uniref:hypothetical protein n=1 Tax=Rahnella sp. AN3-3W3 TaxID=1610578 RepID=UPI001E3DF06E|nr:hypothetical protein [Rahnella sp. AN3-3W3]
MSQILLSGRNTRRFSAGVLLAAGFIFLVLLAVVFPALLTYYDPLNADPVNAQLAPSASHWLGTDQLGRDVLARIIYGSRYSLLISLAAMVVAVSIGTLLGLLAGLFKGPLDELISARWTWFQPFRICCWR